MDYIRNKKPIRSITVDIEDVKKVFERLNEAVIAEGKKEEAKWVKKPDETEEAFEKRRAETLKAAFRVTVTIEGRGGEELYGDSAQLFSSPNMPHDTASVYMTNIVAFRGVAGRDPDNSFSVLLDFSKPPLLDAKSIISAPTENLSNLEAAGSNEWVALITNAVQKTADVKKNRRGGLHAPMIYDLGLAIIGLPLSLYACWKLSDLVKSAFGPLNDFLLSAIYVYLVFLGMWTYRILFGYLKWAFPTVELAEFSSARKHRLAWYAIGSSIALSALYDVIRGMAN